VPRSRRKSSVGPTRAGPLRQRAKTRRNFWRSAVTDAATFVLLAGVISMVVVWKQRALQTRSAKNETPVAKASSRERAAPRSARSERPEMGADPSEPVSAFPEPSSELPASTSSDITSTALTDRRGRTPEVPEPSSVRIEHAPKGTETTTAPSEPSRTGMPEGQPAPQALPNRHPPPRTELANVASPEVEAKPPAPTATVDQKPSGERPRRAGDPEKGAAGSIHKKLKKRLNMARDAATTTPNKLKGSEREPQLVSGNPMALRWPSADEPFVNLGASNR
jgi:hypothetical protein